MSSFLRTYEPVVRASSPTPKGYAFVPKGNVYITGNCRRLTQAAKQTVYAVIDNKQRHIGIRVPAPIHKQVLQDERASRADRASVVEKRDHALEKQFRDAIVSMFPQIPADDIPLVVKRAMQKGARRVGRTGKLDIETKAKLAVRAHIRHMHTDYDAMLRAKTHNRNHARGVVFAKINEVVQDWGGKVDQHGQARRRGKNSRERNGKGKGKGRSEMRSTAKQAHSGKKESSKRGRRSASLVKDKSPRQLKKQQTRLGRQNGSVPVKARIGKSLRQQSPDSDDDMDDESDEFEWRESDDDSDSNWSLDGSNWSE